MQSTQNKFSIVTLLSKLIYYSYFAIRKNRPRCFIKCAFGQMRRLTKCTLQLHWVISHFG